MQLVVHIILVPVDNDRRSRWIAAFSRARQCTADLVSDKESDDPLSPDYVSSTCQYSTEKKTK